MRGTRVLEEIADSFFFHQAGDKSKRRLAVLNREFTRQVGALQLVLEVGKAEIAENLLHDVGNRHVLKDLAVDVHGEQPQPGMNFGGVVHEPLISAMLCELADYPIDVMDVTRALRNLQRHRLSDDRFKGQQGIFRDHRNAVLKKPGDGLFAGVAANQQFVFAQRGGDLDGLIGLLE
jgi:hypothetical protein